MFYQKNKNEFPKISIITPSYNQGKFIEHTIKSVIEQNYPNLEYIIIDGGSTDNSLEIIKRYEKYLSYWTSEPDRGQTHAINKGLAKCTGDIIAYINSDDMYAKNTFFNIQKAFKKYSVNLIYGNFALIDINNNIIQVKREIKFDPLMAKIVGYGILIPQPSTFFTRTLFEKTGFFNENYNFCMDAEYWQRASKYCDFIHLNKILSYFRVHDNSKTRVNSKKIRLAYHAEKQNLLKLSYREMFLSRIIPFNIGYRILVLYRFKRFFVKLFKNYLF
jgi:glycosyltransferase involved in cell wall biosynthesis